MDREQQEQFKHAVERKARESEAASRTTRPGRPRGKGDIEGGQEALRSPSQPQDSVNPRDKSTRHGKVTADKWNQ